MWIQECFVPPPHLCTPHFHSEIFETGSNNTETLSEGPLIENIQNVYNFLHVWCSALVRCFIFKDVPFSILNVNGRSQWSGSLAFISLVFRGTTVPSWSLNGSWFTNLLLHFSCVQVLLHSLHAKVISQIKLLTRAAKPLGYDLRCSRGLGIQRKFFRTPNLDCAWPFSQTREQISSTQHCCASSFRSVLGCLNNQWIHAAVRKCTWDP